MEIDYTNCTITNIRRGDKSQGRDHIIYAHLVDGNGMLVISATLEYITDALQERLPREKHNEP
jgi:hypothetical protein